VVHSYASTLAVVTGASTPRGVAIVRALAEAGVHRFVLSAPATAPLYSLLGAGSDGRSIHFLAVPTEDHTSTEDLLALANTALKYATEGWHATNGDEVWFAACDRLLLINNHEALSATSSSWFELPTPAAGATSSSWEEASELIQANLLAPMTLTRALLPAMIASPLGGAIVNVARVAGRDIGFPFATDSTAASAGLLGFTRALRAQANEAHKHGAGSVTVSAVVDGALSALPGLGGIEGGARGDASDVLEVANAVVWAITYDEPIVQVTSAWLAKALGATQLLFPRALELLAEAQSHLSRTPPHDHEASAHSRGSVS
jgi:NAD(P)-dependent dehydrogenase (short-subunit alcohol dehydrogenase family)